MDEKKKKMLCVAAVVLCAVSVGYQVMHPYEQKRVEKLTYTNDRVVTGSQDKNTFPVNSRESHAVRSSGRNDTGRRENVTAISEKKSVSGKLSEFLKVSEPSELSELSEFSESLKPTYSDPLFAAFFHPSHISGVVRKNLFEIYRKPVPLKKAPIKIPEKQPDPDPIPVNLPEKEDPVKKVVDYITSFTFLGHYESGSRKAVFLSRNKLVLVARVGDRINGKYLIEQITDDKIKIKALDINETIHLDIKQFKDFKK